MSRRASRISTLGSRSPMLVERGLRGARPGSAPRRSSAAAAGASTAAARLRRGCRGLRLDGPAPRPPRRRASRPRCARVGLGRRTCRAGSPMRTCSGTVTSMASDRLGPSTTGSPLRSRSRQRRARRASGQRAAQRVGREEVRRDDVGRGVLADRRLERQIVEADQAALEDVLLGAHRGQRVLAPVNEQAVARAQDAEELA